MSGFRFDARRNRWLSACLAAGVVSAMAGVASAGSETMKPETLERVKRAAVMVFTAASRNSAGDTPQSSGSGYFINNSGMLITNNHVVDPAHGKPIWERQGILYPLGTLVWTVITDSGTDDEKSWQCKMVYQNESADQAILQAVDEEENLLETPDYLRFMPDSRLQVRRKLWAFGFPGGDRQRTSRDKHPKVAVTQGMITELPRKASGRIEMIFTDVQVRPGNSGGAMVDANGFVVGTATLMGQTEGRADTSMLVPIALSRQFVHNAFLKGLVRPGSNFTPFMDLFTDESGRINIGQYERLADQDVLYFESGDRIYGSGLTKEITWESDIGTLVVPMDAAAYVMTHDEGADLYLEGGNRVAAAEAGITFKFRPVGGEVMEQELDEVKVVALRTSDRRLEPVIGEVLVFDSDLAYLVLKDIKGTLKFESNVAGLIEIPLNKVSRIETTPDEDQLVIMTDGRRISGMFTEDMIEARIAATGMPIKFQLSAIGEALVNQEYRGLNDVAGLGLQGVLAGADRKIKKLADKVDSLDLGNVRQEIEKQMTPEMLKRLPIAAREHLFLLRGVVALRQGDYDTAKSNLRRCTRSKDSNMAAYSKATIEVMDRFEGHQFEGEPISDRVVLAKAGASVADEISGRVKEFMLYADRWKLKDMADFPRGVYPRHIGKIRGFERDMDVVAVLGGIEAEEQLHRLWMFASRLAILERFRLGAEIEKEQEEQDPRGGRRNLRGRRGGGGGRGAGGARQATERKIRELEEAREKAIETYAAYQKKLNDAGFRIDDPDIDAFRRAQDDDGP